jgi:acetylornithine deacetylase
MRCAILGRALSLLERFVAFDTTNCRSNSEMIHDIAECLEAVGFQIGLTWNTARSKANLLASIGPDVSGGLILSGHTDVVPVDGQPWSSDPSRPLSVKGKCTVAGRPT